jgi:hypothetical protein
VPDEINSGERGLPCHHRIHIVRLFVRDIDRRSVVKGRNAQILEDAAQALDGSSHM